MKTLVKTALAQALALLLSTTGAMAESTLSQSQLSAVITGNTIYVTMPVGAPGAPDGGDASLYFGEDGAATARLPSGAMLNGGWMLVDQGYCIDWSNGPRNSCSSIARSEGSFVVINAATGEPRGHVFTIATGNPENL